MKALDDSKDIIFDERELQNTTKEKHTKTERSKGNRDFRERVRAKWFCCSFRLDL